jgi:Myristoyl-CoA:protein N-myristoyltransferase, N-terminal domain
LANEPTAPSGTRRSIEDFRGDIPALAELLERSWEENSQQALSYSPAFLESFLSAPGFTASLAPSFYQEQKLIGFASGFPRQAVYNGRPLQLVTNSFLSVLPEFKKSGLGVVLWTELVKRCQAAGYDGMVNFCIDGEPMNRMIEGCCKRLKLPVQRILSVRYMSGLLKPENFSASESEKSSAVRVEDFMDLAAPLATTQPFARLWNRKEADWQCFRRAGVVVAEVVHESRRGILTGYVMSILDKERTKVLLVEDIFWAELSNLEREQLLQKFLTQAVAQGARMATLPMLGYSDLSAFKKFRFLPTRRTLHCYLTPFKGEMQLETLSSMYMDVF